MPPPRLPTDQHGFTLVELIVVVAIIAVMASLFLGGPSAANPFHRVGDTAREVRARINIAITRSEASGGEAVFYVDARQVGERRGRFLAMAAAAGVTRDTATAPEWMALDDGAQWAWGNATTDPLGGPSGGAVPGTVRCGIPANGSTARCALGARRYVVYPIAHAREGAAVSAVVLRDDASTTMYRYQPGTSTWHAEAER